MNKIIKTTMAEEIPVSRTKIIIPTLRPEILHRRRLLEYFDDLLEKKLIIISAPAGYGKTSLLADFAHLSEMPVCWLSLDDLDQDPQRFCWYLIAAIEQRFPKFGGRSKSVLRSLTSFDRDGERFLSILINEIDSQIDQHFALMVDDFQFVDTVASVRNLFSRFIFLAGENCHIVLSSRRLPTLPDITLMVAREQVGGFSMDELAFQPQEIRSLFENNYGIRLDDRVIDELVTHTEGWITGIQLSAPKVSSGLPDMSRAARASGVDLDRYLEQQVIAPQPPKVRSFLLHTSLLEEFDVDLCEAVFGVGNWKSLMKTIRQNNLFVMQVGPNGKWLRYHRILQDFLNQRVNDEEPEFSRMILLRLAALLEERGEWEKSYALYRQLKDHELLPTLIERAGMPMLLSERLITLQTWLNNLSTQDFQQRPVLLSLKGALLCSIGDGKLAISTLDRAIQEFLISKNNADLAQALVRRSASYRLVGEYANSLKDAEEALSLSENKPELQFINAEAKRYKGIVLHHLGKIAEASRIQEEALQSYEKSGDKQRAAWVQNELGMNYRAMGNYPKALQAFTLALEEWQQENNLPSQADVFNSLGVMYHHQGKYEQAVQAIEDGLECASISNSYWQVAILLTSLGDVYLDLNEYDPAYQAYCNAAQAVERINFQFLTNYLGLAQARLARKRGQVKEAYLYLGEVELQVLSSNSNYECGLYFLEHGCLKLMGNNIISANADLEQALSYFQKGGFMAEAGMSQVWLAIVQFEAGKIVEARKKLRAILRKESQKPLNYPIQQAVRDAHRWMGKLQEDAECATILAPWMEQIQQAEAGLPALLKRLRRISNTVPLQVPTLLIHAYGKPQVWVQGKFITSKQWKTASVRELFFYLMTCSRPSSKEEIGAILWPEMNTQEMRLRFKNEMYRLRHALGKDAIRFENNLYSFNRMLDYEYDVERLNQSLTKAKSAKNVEEKINYLTEATRLRSGPYLQDLDATWVWPEREQLDRSCTDAWLQLAEYQHQSGDLQAAIQACQAALRIDKSREDIHCLAMQLHAEMGDRLGIIWQFQACQEALRTDLDVNPSQKTQDLFRRLTI